MVAGLEGPTSERNDWVMRSVPLTLTSYTHVSSILVLGSNVRTYEIVPKVLRIYLLDRQN
jgi:hypothetical protein